MNIKSGTKFELGQIVATPPALVLIEKSGQTASDFINRHHSLEQGELGDDDHASNVESVENGTQILSSYKTNNGDKIWVITEGDRSATTVLRPEDY